MKLKVVQVPSIAEPITRSPGFEKKQLSDHKLDLMALCGFGCTYCSSNAGNYLRINREKFADLTQAQTGARTYPSDDPALTFTWPDVLTKLERQIDRKSPSWGAGKTLVVSMLTDAFSPLALSDGTTDQALRMVLKRTSFRIRILTKGAAVGSSKWLAFLRDHKDRVVVGLSTGTLDDAWASRVEIGTSSPHARLGALGRLQEWGVPTFGMLCPVFPDMLEGDRLEQLVDRIRPDLVEHVWAEPYNDRTNWRAVRAGYEEGSAGWEWLTEVYERGRKDLWSAYAAELYERLVSKARRDGWAHKLRYLLYEGDIAAKDASRFAGLEGVLLQSKPDEEGFSANPSIREVQSELGPKRTGAQIDPADLQGREMPGATS